MQLQQNEVILENTFLEDMELYPVRPQRESRRIKLRQSVYLIAKRAFDLLSALFLLVVVSPLMLGIAIAIKWDSRGPILFKHRRVGKNGNDIFLFKFRSMVVNAENLIQQFTPQQRNEWENNYKLKDDPRITRVGKFLRKTSLDELPQLFNIIMGNLSVIGPRPVVADELQKYGFNKHRFLSVKPGLTGYWQANGRSDVTYEERMEMELYYVENASTKLDLRILLRSLVVVAKKKGAI